MMYGIGQSLVNDWEDFTKEDTPRVSMYKRSIGISVQGLN